MSFITPRFMAPTRASKARCKSSAVAKVTSLVEDLSSWGCATVPTQWPKIRWSDDNDEKASIADSAIADCETPPPTPDDDEDKASIADSGIADCETPPSTPEPDDKPGFVLFSKYDTPESMAAEPDSIGAQTSLIRDYNRKHDTPCAASREGVIPVPELGDIIDIAHKTCQEAVFYGMLRLRGPNKTSLWICPRTVRLGFGDMMDDVGSISAHLEKHMLDGPRQDDRIKEYVERVIDLRNMYAHFNNKGYSYGYVSEKLFYAHVLVCLFEDEERARILGGLRTELSDIFDREVERRGLRQYEPTEEEKEKLMWNGE